MKSFIHSIPKRFRYFGLLLFNLVIIGLLALGPLRAQNYRSKASQIIESHLEKYANEPGTLYSCQISAFSKPPDHADLRKAVAFLEKAQEINPQDTLTKKLLGQAYCLLGEYQSAINAFVSYNQARPGNLYISLEATFAHITLIILNDSLSEGEILDQTRQSLLILEEQGLSVDFFIEHGNTYFRETRYQRAWFMYHAANLFEPLEDETAFRTELMDLVFGRRTMLGKNIHDEFVLKLEDTLLIPPNNLFRLANGSRVHVIDRDGKAVGIYWSNTDPGGIFLQVNDSGTFCLAIQAIDRPPETTLIEVTLGLDRLMMIELSKGDDAWRTTTTKVFLVEGLHLLGLRLTNDELVNGVDRNGNVGEIAIARCD